MLIDFVNICVSDGATISPAIFRSLFGILSRPAALLSFNLDNSLRTTSAVGAFRGNVVFVLVCYAQ